MHELNVKVYVEDDTYKLLEQVTKLYNNITVNNGGNALSETEMFEMMFVFGDGGIKKQLEFMKNNFRINQPKIRAQ